MEVWVFLVLSVSVYPGVSEAASFACAKASTPVEKVICSDSELSKLDGNLAVLYASRRQMLGGVGAQALINEQRAWLGERSATCSVVKEGGPVPSVSSKCLINVYQARIAAINGALLQQIAATTAFHPEFWGMDLEKTFPELKRLEDKTPENQHIDTNGVPNHPLVGNQIRNVYINKNREDVIFIFSHADKYYPGKPQWSTWVVSIFRNTIQKVNDEYESRLGSDWEKKNPSISMEAGDGYRLHKIGVNIIGAHEYCRHPLGEENGVALYKSGESQPIAEMWPIFKKGDLGLIWSGGAGCQPRLPMVSFAFGAEIPNVNIFPLPDGTFLMWEELFPNEIVRLDSHLRSPYRSPHFVLLDRQQLEHLPMDKGESSMQGAALRLFDREYDTEEP